MVSRAHDVPARHVPLVLAMRCHYVINAPRRRRAAAACGYVIPRAGAENGLPDGVDEGCHHFGEPGLLLIGQVDRRARAPQKTQLVRTLVGLDEWERRRSV